jgi:hypothetical protein
MSLEGSKRSERSALKVLCGVVVCVESELGAGGAAGEGGILSDFGPEPEPGPPGSNRSRALSSPVDKRDLKPPIRASLTHL